MRIRHVAMLGAISVCMLHGSTPSRALDEDITNQGGDTSVADSSNKAYGHVAPNIADDASVALHEVGQTGFLRDFSKVKIRGSLRLGPIFNAPSCASCHGGNGRGALRITRGKAGSDTVVKVSVPSGKSSAPGGPVPVPSIGFQLRDHAIARVQPEAHVGVTWRQVLGTYADGTPYSLRSPIVKLSKPSTPLPKNVLKSLRRAPPIFGSGLLDAVSEAEILSRADPLDADGDSVSGRPNMVWDVQTKTTRVGKFGFKASASSLKQQIAAAYATDMGVTNPLFKNGARVPDITFTILDATTFYSATLGVPMARNQTDPIVTQGRTLFSTVGCHSCHTPTLQTGDGVHTSLSHQTIHPFSDLLLHDMGTGLSDNRPDFLATGSEWKTTPLWGIGLTETVLNGRPATYLHDGRARTLEEAILWHGGEASPAQARFAALSAPERDALIAFLRSL